jgi:hypothetical protein
MLRVYAPYGAVFFVALAAYLLLPWRIRFLATAVVMGPFTWVRPLVALAGGLLGVLAADRGVTRAAVVLAVVAVLAVPHVADRLWYAARPLRVRS